MPKDARGRIRSQIHTEGLITMQHIAIHGPRPRPDARAHIAAVSFGDYELLGDAADIMARQRTRQR
jgi:hypothetical protein